MHPRNLAPSNIGNVPVRSARLNALQAALSALDSYMLDECPGDQNWEDFDPDVDQLRTQINGLIDAG